MTRTVFFTATTLDGFLADDNDSLDWLFKQDIDSAGANSYDDFISGVGAVVMGRTTYEWVREHLLASQEPWSFQVPVWVLSHRALPGVEGADIRFAQGDVQSIHAALTAAAGGKDVYVVGGGDLAAQFAEAGLLDELVLSIAPATLGSGRPLFPRKFDLELKEVARNRSFICATYKVLGPARNPAP